MELEGWTIENVVRGKYIMKWIKKGQIYSPEIMRANGMILHSQNPVPVVLEDRIRIFFACRPQHDISVPTYIDVAKYDMKKILYCNKQPILELGKRGTFDEFGIIPTEIVWHDDELWMYYTGWQRGINITYTLSIGLAVSRDQGQTFYKKYEGPVLDRTKDEPYMTMAPCIFYEDLLWHAYYASGIGFLQEKDKYEPQYIIKYATSEDGINWHQKNIAVIEKQMDDESNTRPTVVKMNGEYHMWFCYRGGHDYRGGERSYRIGYAKSSDLKKWFRDDSAAGIDVSSSGWDSEIITYPYVREIEDKYYMFYNGNGFGKTGFGYAELQ